jgi:pyruvate dehydrogenase E2 component (dihydrolipoamide acetyltransferase)
VASEVVMPRLGWNMEEGSVASWRRKSGETVAAGDVLFEVESDKATQEVEALEGGVLHIPADSPAAGTVVPVGTVLAWLLAPGETPPAALPSPRPATAPAAGATSRTAPKAPPPSPLPAARPESTAPAASRRRVAISPRARRAAGQLHVDWTRLRGSGSTGRIIERDVREAAARHGVGGPGAARAGTVILLSAEADATELVRLQASLGGTPATATLALLLRVIAEALRQFPGLLGPEGAPVDLAVFTAATAGLASTMVRDAGSMPLRELLAALSEPASPDTTRPTFAVVDVGSRDIDAFTPVLPGLACPALGLGRIAARPVVTDPGKGTVAVRRMMVISCAFDAGVADLDTGSRFLQAVKRYVENPWLCLAGP